MRERFDAALAFTLQWEGGYSCDPDDPGGETNWGISKRTYPHLDIKGLTRDDAAAIYRRDYWDSLKLDGEFTPLDITLFDSAVNLGPWRALHFKRQAGSWSGVLDRREAYYTALAEQKPWAKKYLKGWLSRCRALRELCAAIEESLVRDCL
jgi:hypothetical protein